MSIEHEFKIARDNTESMLIRMEGLIIALDLVAYAELQGAKAEPRMAILELISTVRDQFRDLEKLRRAEWEAQKGDKSEKICG